MALSVQVTISMPIWMVEEADEQANKYGISRSEYIRHLVQESAESPFDQPETELYADENSELSENIEGAA